jgi:sialic acid synthase SpsE
MLRRLELSVDQMAPLVRRAHDLGIHAIVTVFSLELVADAQRLPWDAYKTASPDIVHGPLLEALSASGRPLIVSTGAAEFAEVRRAAEWLSPARERLAVLQCVSSYPTKKEDAAIGAMAALRELPGLRGRIGYSDHTREVDTGEVAADAGACVLEKHLTYDRKAAGPDHAASLEPGEFRRYSELARDASTLRLRVGPEVPATSDVRLGAPVKRVLDCERDVRAVSRQSITACRPLQPGQILRREELTFKRPGTGLHPFRLNEVLGRRILRPVEADMPIMPADVEGIGS